MIVEEQKHCPTRGWGPEALEEVQKSRREFQERLASRRGEWIRANRYFYKRLERALQFIVKPGRRVLDMRCETGHIRASRVTKMTKVFSNGLRLLGICWHAGRRLEG